MFIARGKEDALVTRNLVPGDAVYGEKRISVDVRYLIFSVFFFFLIYQAHALSQPWACVWFPEIVLQKVCVCIFVCLSTPT